MSMGMLMAASGQPAGDPVPPTRGFLTRTFDGLAFLDDWNRGFVPDIDNDWILWDGQSWYAHVQDNSLIVAQGIVGIRHTGSYNPTSESIAQFTNLSNFGTSKVVQNFNMNNIFMSVGDFDVVLQGIHVFSKPFPGGFVSYRMIGAASQSRFALHHALQATSASLLADFTASVNETTSIISNATEISFENSGGGNRHDNFFFCGRNITVVGLGAGSTVNLVGPALTRSVVETNGTASFSCDFYALPITTLQVTTGSQTLADFTPTDGIWGGDEFLFTVF